MSRTSNDANAVMVPLASIPTDEGSQTRVRVRASVVRDYAAAMAEQMADGGLRFPPVILFTDGNAYWVGDGLHCVLAAATAGLTEIAAEVRPGTRRDAVLFGMSANSAHGLPRSNLDKRKAVAVLLADPEWSQWSDREIAKRCRVGNAFVSRLRRRASVSGTQISRKVERAGSVYQMTIAPRAGETPADPARVRDNAPIVDSLGIPLPEACAKTFSALPDFQEAQARIEELAKMLHHIAQGPSGELYRRELIRTENAGRSVFACSGLRMCLNTLLASEPYCSSCPSCHAVNPARPCPSCKKCGGRGWTTRAAFESCPPSERQLILTKVRT